MIGRKRAVKNGVDYHSVNLYFTQRSYMAKKEPLIKNYIELDGIDTPIDLLSYDNRKKLSIKLQDKIMLPIGYRSVKSK